MQRKTRPTPTPTIALLAILGLWLAFLIVVFSVIGKPLIQFLGA